METSLEQFSREESEESWFEEGIDRELDENSVISSMNPWKITLYHQDLCSI